MKFSNQITFWKLYSIIAYYPKLKLLSKLQPHLKLLISYVKQIFNLDNNTDGITDVKLNKKWAVISELLKKFKTCLKLIAILYQTYFKFVSQYSSTFSLENCFYKVFPHSINSIFRITIWLLIASLYPTIFIIPQL